MWRTRSCSGGTTKPSASRPRRRCASSERPTSRATRSTPHSSTCSSAAVAMGSSVNCENSPMSKRRAPRSHRAGVVDQAREVLARRPATSMIARLARRARATSARRRGSPSCTDPSTTCNRRRRGSRAVRRRRRSGAPRRPGSRRRRARPPPNARRRRRARGRSGLPSVQWHAGVATSATSPPRSASRIASVQLAPASRVTVCTSGAGAPARSPCHAYTFRRKLAVDHGERLSGAHGRVGCRDRESVAHRRDERDAPAAGRRRRRARRGRVAARRARTNRWRAGSRATPCCAPPRGRPPSPSVAAATCSRS